MLDLILLLAAGAAVAAAWITLAPVGVGGGSLGAVAGKSMEPTLRSGDLIVVRPGAYRVGEIVAYRSGGGLVVHRIVSVANGRLVMRGDANDDVDPVRRYDIARERCSCERVEDRDQGPILIPCI